MKRYVLIIVALLCVWQAPGQRRIPAAVLEDLQGKRYEIHRAFSDSIPVVLAFWSTACKPCIQELDALSELYEDWKQMVDFKVVAVAVDDSRTAIKVRPMAEGREWPFEVLLDKNQDLKRAMNVHSIPFVYVSDKRGNVVYTHSGYTPGSEAGILEALKKLKP